MVIAAVLGLYATFLVAGWLASRKGRGGTAQDLMVAGRSMPVWLATLTMTATWVDGGYLLGTAEGAFRSGLASGLQGGVCFGASLILGGLLFAGPMRRFEFTTLIDPFEVRFGKRWAATLFVPAMLAEVFWSAELLAAIGSTLGVMSGMKVEAAIVLSAVVVTAYTMVGGMWSVAYTDVLQLGLVALGLLVALPLVLGATGGFAGTVDRYFAARPAVGGISWDVTAMLVLGGIPWNCYFQRVLACQTPAKARTHSILAGLLTMSFTLPPLLLGMAALVYPWSPALLAQIYAEPSRALPMLFQHAVPLAATLLGLGAITCAVTSSFSASILSAGSMFAWNGCHRLMRPDLGTRAIKRLIRGSILVLGLGAALMALEVRSVQALWFFTSDLVFVLLFPQLVAALFDPRANIAGSVAAFATSLVLRVGAGEPLVHLPRVIPYSDDFPFRITAALAGMVLLPVVSRVTARRWPPRPVESLR